MQTLRLLFWLKWKLTLRGYQRNASLLIGALLMLLIFLPAAVGLAGLCGLGFIVLREHGGNDTHLLRAVLLGIYLAWLLSPLLGYALNDTFDITRLFAYPVRIRQIFLGTVLGSLLDLTSLLVLPTLLAALYGFTHDPMSALLNLVTLALFIFHTLTLSQAMILVSAGVLRSRRFRDSLMLLFSILGTLYFLGTISLANGKGHFDWRGFIESPAWQIVNYLPSGLAARAMEAAEHGRPDNALVFIVLLAAATAATLYFAGIVVQRVYESGGERGDASADSPRQKAGAIRPERQSGLLRRLPLAMQAIMEKEFKYLFRDPYFRMLLSNFAYLTVVSIFLANTLANSSLHQRSGGGAMPSMGGSGLVLFTELSMVCNIYGTEGFAITLLFLYPCARRHIILGKNLAMFLTLSVLNLLYISIYTLVSRQYAMLGMSYALLEISLILFLGLGNAASIYAPYRVVMKGWRVRQQSASKGCAYTLLYFLIMLIAFVLMLPVLAAFFGPAMLEETQWYALTIPLAFLYAAGLYAASIFISTSLLAQREEQIHAKVAMDEA